jgi:AraC family transcriptional regulator
MQLKLSPGESRARTQPQTKAAGVTSWETLYAPDFRMPSHEHSNAFLYLVLRGALMEVCGRQVQTALPATLIVHPPRQVHANHFLQTGAHTLNIQLDAGWLERLEKHSITLDRPVYYPGGQVPGFAARLYQETQRTDAASGLVTEGLILEILGETARLGAPVTERKPPRWLRQAKDLLHAQFSSALTLDKIAAANGVHPVYLSTMFRQQFGCTIGDYVRRLRIDDACRRLVRSELPLAEIALEAGFAIQSHFSRTFKRLTGLTPSEYRRIFSS